MTATRTDVHAPASPDFDPQAYNCHGVFDFAPEFDPSQTAERQDLVNKMISRGYHFGGSTTGGCGHCGTNIRYGALMARDDIMEMIWVGETCLGNRFDGITKTKFQKLRKAAALNRELVTRATRFEALCDENPDLAYASYASNIHDTVVVDDGTRFGNASGCSWALSTLTDLADKAHRYGNLTERQLAFMMKLMTEVSEKGAKFEISQVQCKKEQAVVPAPIGRTVITGTVLKTEWKENGYDGRLVMTVKHADGWEVWGSVPGSLTRDEYGRTSVDHIVRAGDVVTFTATIEASDRPEFGFFKRPTKASKVK